jgi:hypothetical protein
MTGTSAACLHTSQSRSYLNHLVFKYSAKCMNCHMSYVVIAERAVMLFC